MPADKVPFWDFNAPGITRGGAGAKGSAEPRDDASAAAIIASACMSLAGTAWRMGRPIGMARIYFEQSDGSLPAPIGTNKGFILLHSTAESPPIRRWTFRSIMLTITISKPCYGHKKAVYLRTNHPCI